MDSSLGDTTTNRINGKAVPQDEPNGARKGQLAVTGETRKLTILIAKGDISSATFLARMLEPMGHKVVVATEGIEAWSILREHRVDLVFSDWALPGLEGEELCRRIREISDRPRTYIVGVAASDGSDDRLDSLAAGADDFLTKPFTSRELIARLNIAKRHIALQAELEKKTGALRALATTDELTGLKNRRQFFEDLDSHFAQGGLGQSPLSPEHSERFTRKWSPLSLILLDVDHFKAYNDAFGHPAGDDVLRGVADVLRSGSRSYDTVVRHGGEEFAVLLPDADRSVALAMAERLRKAIELHDWPHRPVTASFGVATMILGGSRARDLIDQADRALYGSKRGGRNRVTQSVDLGEGSEGTPPAETREHPSPQGHTPHPGVAATEQVPTCDDFVEGWARALVLRNSETDDHSRRVTAKVLKLARALGIDEAEMLHIRRGAMLHDIGKIGIPDSILLKPGPLSEDEWEVMRRHPEYAYNIMSPVAFLRPALDIPYAHHERWDGNGYPRGLEGEQIPLAARVFAAVDIWDALSHDRPYRDAWPTERVRAYVAGLSGTHLDPRVVEVMQQTFAGGIEG